ncbi:type II toxin-antitoxin system VapC family toxin [Candidatus Poriferisodalis sp.]|uniref:type II toxin-antitoxin system VapC family toxin n=1 Tax=Candidatus Poriferisodalis sp. TaxID=3101277 RepID=UPI003B010164
MIVLDSSAAVEWLLGLPLADAVAQRLSQAESIHAPALVDVEVAHVVRRYAAEGEISDRRGTEALEALADLDAVRYSHEMLLPLIWRLRHNLTAYDAAFVALAAVLGATLVTLDAGMARARWPLQGDALFGVDHIA